jgi:hypothetical protein
MSDYMIDLSNDNLEEGRERQAVKEGEYTLRIKDWKSDDDGKIKMTNEKGFPYIMPILEVINCEEAEFSKDITHYLALPDSGLDKKKLNDAKYQLRCFFEAFGVDYHQPLDPEGMIGETAEALLVVQEDTGYGEQNRVKRWIASH